MSGWYDKKNYGQCPIKNYRPICTCSLCYSSNDTLSCAKPLAMADVVEDVLLSRITLANTFPKVERVNGCLSSPQAKLN